MIFDAEDFSSFEFCPRYPQLRRTFEPPRWSIRDAAKMFFKTGIRQIMAGQKVEDFIGLFTNWAASPGFLYPSQAEPYILAKDHESWLEGALRLIHEERGILEQLPLFEVENHHLHIESWQAEDGSIHLFRIRSNFGQRELKWPELCLLALEPRKQHLIGNDIHIHVYRLPSVRDGRILSPLSMAYQHPTFTNTRYRLARLYDEDEFSKSWKKVSRWEIQPSVDWEEWRRGIENDKALPLIRESYSISPKLDDESQKNILFDIAQMMNAMEKPSIFPRYREKCNSCVMDGICHGDQATRAEYQIVSEK